MGKFKNFLKKFVPPPMNVFMREIDRVVALEETNQILLQRVITEQQSLQQFSKKQQKLLEQQTKDINRLNSQLHSLEKNIFVQQKKDFDSIRFQLQSLEKNYWYEYRKRLSPEQYKSELEHWYRNATGKKLNLSPPKTFNEKIQWLKLYDSTPQKTALTDKFAVREIIEAQIGTDHFIPLLGVWDDPNEIDFDILPNQFVLKTTHGAGWNIIVKDKSILNLNNIRKQLKSWMEIDFAFTFGFEMHYSDIPLRIIAEEYHPCEFEYQFWCFNGVPKFISAINEPHGKNIKATYDINWHELDFVTSLPKFEQKLERPFLFDKMLSISEKLCKNFTFVRIDFMHDGNQFYFSEMTFTPGSGICRWTPPKYDKIIGDMLILPDNSSL